MTEEEERAKRPMIIGEKLKKRANLKHCDECPCCKAWMQMFAMTKQSHNRTVVALRKTIAYYKNLKETVQNFKKI